MAARAIWKGVIRIGRTELPVKLYSAVQDRTIHFRLLHKSDRQPVRQELHSSDSDETVEFRATKKAFEVSRDRMVVLEPEELAELEPKESRDIDVSRFVDPESIDHRWYERAYYLGPDNSRSAYFALAEALQKKNKEGVARWVMRKKSYVGALRAEDGYLMLITLRHAEEIVEVEAIEAPQGRALDKREVDMARQLIAALEEPFDPKQFRDEYRERVMELVETKAKGGRAKVVKFRPKKASPDKGLAGVLEASLAGLRKSADKSTKKRSAGGSR